MFYSGGVFAMGKAALQGNEVEKRLANLLCDDLIQVISTFQLNQIASLTYHEGSIADGDDLCEVIFEKILKSCLSKPLQYSPLTLEKALVVTKHCLLVGSARTVNEANVLGKHIESLQNYNTVILAQQQSGLSGTLMRLKGGGVDKGGKVRERAKEVLTLLMNKDLLNIERDKHADPNSLVPVGDNRLAFASDEVRLYALKKRIEHQQMIEVKSNLAKAEGGFGGGYNSRDGSQVVGAAHGLEEMMKMAEIHKKRHEAQAKKFKDDPKKMKNVPYSSYVAPVFDAEDFLAGQMSSPTAAATTAGTTDLLAVDDLLSFGTTSAPAPAPHGEIDLLGFMGGADSSTGGSGTSAFDTMDLLGTAASAPAGDHDFFGSTTIAAAPSSNSNDLLQIAATTTSNKNDIFSLDPLASSNADTTSLSSYKQTDIFSTTDLMGSLTLSSPAAAATSPNIATATNGSTGGTNFRPPPGSLLDPTTFGPSITEEHVQDLQQKEQKEQQKQQQAAMAKKPVMESNEDRFAALDNLATDPKSSAASGAAAQGALSRILGGGLGGFFGGGGPSKPETSEPTISYGNTVSSSLVVPSSSSAAEPGAGVLDSYNTAGGDFAGMSMMTAYPDAPSHAYTGAPPNAYPAAPPPPPPTHSLEPPSTYPMDLPPSYPAEAPPSYPPEPPPSYSPEPPPSYPPEPPPSYPPPSYPAAPPPPLPPASAMDLASGGLSITHGSMDAQEQQNRMRATYAATSLKISAQHTPPSWGGGSHDEGDDENGFVMGGTEGAGLNPW